ncbi:MAG: Pyroglutamyl peptidase [Pseudomonadota bacterium]|jgi:pyrrolidone-carboxylate peptidase
MQRKVLLVFLPLIVFISGCGAPQNGTSESELATDLGLTGNSRVARNFESYKSNRSQGCTNSGSTRKRVLLSGFGPFNRKHNISGAVVDLLQRSSLWPAVSAWPQNGQFDVPEFKPDDSPGASGGIAIQRTLTFDGQEMELCLLKLTVEWDFAAAVILHEAESFQPDFILMTGYGANPTGVRLEAGALNKTSRLSGFDPRGKALGEVNAPVSDWIVPRELNLPDEIAMNWQPQKIASRHRLRLDQFSESLGRREQGLAWRFVPMESADPLNNYVCNNVSYAVLAGLRLGALPLAGGRLTLAPKFRKMPGAAFLHYPFNSDVTASDEVWMWAHLVAGIIADTHALP